jgi:transposase
LTLARFATNYIAVGYTDLRKGIDSLAAIVMLQYGLALREDSLFLFYGRRTDRIKALYCDSHGLRP